MRPRLLAFLCLFLFARQPGLAQDPVSPGGFEYSAGTSFLIYQSVFSMDGTLAFEGTMRGPIAPAWRWQAGFRLGFSPERPELFGGVLLTQGLGSWRPAIGVELGVTSRAKFAEGKGLLRETRQTMEGNISPVYVAMQTAPLSFAFSERWRVSFLEIHIGTHLSHIGRTMRAQVGIVTVGATL
jgi:hypothetical protein